MNTQLFLKVFATPTPTVTHRSPWIDGPGGGWVFHFSDGTELIVATDIRMEMMVMVGPVALPAGSPLVADSVQRGARVVESPQLSIRSFILRRGETILGAIAPTPNKGMGKLTIYFNSDSGLTVLDFHERLHAAFHSLDGIKEVNLLMTTPVAACRLEEVEQEELEALNAIRIFLFLLHTTFLHWIAEDEGTHTPPLFTHAAEIPPIVAEEFSPPSPDIMYAP